MRCLTAGLVLLLSFSIVVCVPSCTSCSKSKKERVERQVTTDNEIPINDQNIDSRPGWNLSQQDVNRNTIEKPNYSNTLHTSDTDISSVLNSGEILKDIPIEEYSEDHRKHCPECHNGSVERINSHKHVGCVCALFTTPFADDAPLISKTFHNVSCHHHVSEEDACTRVCLSLAVFYYKVKDNLICSHAHNATDLMASLHTKVCNANSKWIFTGLVTNQPICCHNGKPVMCDTEVHDGKMSDIVNNYH